MKKIPDHELVKWTDQLAEEIHKPVSKKLRKRRVYVKGSDQISPQIWSICNRFLRYNNGVKYLLTVMIFSQNTGGLYL